MITLEIWQDGDLVHRRFVTKRSEVRAAMESYPPATARGGVVSVLAPRNASGTRVEKQVIATSGHSINGPRWVREVRI